MSADNQPADTPTRPPRMLVPDVARGLALLGIALANAPTAWFLDDDTTERADYFGGAVSSADDAAVLFTAVTSHVRGLPMFSTLLGFGVGLIVMSLWRRGFPVGRTRAVVVRRYAFLALFGALHGIVLFHGDIMFFYGVAGIVLGLVFTWTDKVLMRVALGMLCFWTLMGVSMSIGAFFEPEALAFGGGAYTPADTYPAMLLNNLSYFAFQALSTPFFLIQLFPVMIIGFVWARRGTLSDVAAHRRELLIWAGVGVVIAVGIGLPWGLSALGIVPADMEPFFMFLNNALGVFTGPGILAALALLIDGVQRRVWDGAAAPAWLSIPAALGKRSMSGYLVQSLLFFIVASPFLFGLDLDAFGMSIIAFFIWVATLVGAAVLEALGKQGPFEHLHRRLSYGPTGRAELSAPGRA